MRACDLFSDLSIPLKHITERTEPFMVLGADQSVQWIFLQEILELRCSSPSALTLPQNYYGPVLVLSRWLIAGISPEQKNIWGIPWSLVTQHFFSPQQQGNQCLYKLSDNTFVMEKEKEFKDGETISMVQYN